MSTKYTALLTQVGAARLANAIAQGKQLAIARMGVGDGGGILPTPDPSQTALLNEKRRAAINSLSIDPTNANQIIVEQVIPENEGGFWLREIGLYDDDDNLIAVANCPETYKPQLQEGSGRVQTVRMILAVSQVDAVSLKIDPAVVLASRQYVDDKALSSQTYTNTKVTEVKSYTDNGLAAHIAAVNPHKQYAPIESPVFTGNPTAPTPPLFDADSSLATTAFVQRSLGNLQGVYQIKESTTLTRDAFGRFIEVISPGITLTLPDATLCQGGVIELRNASAGVLSVSGSGKSIVGSVTPVGSDSIVLQSGTYVRLLTTGGDWRVSGANLPLDEIAGIPLPWPQSMAPTGWLKCNGQSFDKNLYPKLAQVYPSGLLPDLRGEFIRGWDDGRGVDSNRSLLSLQGDAIRNITGFVSGAFVGFDLFQGAFFDTGSRYANVATPTGGVNLNDDFAFDASRVVPTANENRPRNIAFNYIVRAA
ncbi:phage tail protein [Dickeya oryzae]|uniref:phage tail-collar fiber domain-containing protein n=1 Tax=Dickeya oryzae TaxID=1240404 RepID=UPI0020980444|nr:phage tail protein [Dickeya oryzae]MCO7254763.1 phage tail protein [Dickeya oryzae]